MPRFLDTRGKANLAIAVCARCRLKMANADMVRDPETRELMHPHCTDEPDPYRLPARIPDRMALPFAQPDSPMDALPSEPEA